MRTILVGDVHGHLDALKTLLWSVGLNRETDQLVLLGNLMDYGPDSCGVYLYVRELQEDMKRRLICLRGNHEQMGPGSRTRISSLSTGISGTRSYGTTPGIPLSGDATASCTMITTESLRSSAIPRSRCRPIWTAPAGRAGSTRSTAPGSTSRSGG